MKLWLIEQHVNGGYDTYSDAVVAAETEDLARRIHPDGGEWSDKPKDNFGWAPNQCGWAWAPSPEEVSAKLIGEAVNGTAQGVICASFHAG